jgi:hypothetical protein
LDFRHGSTTQDQCAELIHQSILIVRVFIGEIFLQPFEKLALAICLAFQAEPNQRRDRLAHTDINRLRIPLHLARQG